MRQYWCSGCCAPGATEEITSPLGYTAYCHPRCRELAQKAIEQRDRAARTRRGEL